MILIGIISVQRKNDLLSYIKSKKINICDRFGEDIYFLPIEINLYKNLKLKALYKKVKKAKALLKKEGVLQILLTKELQSLLGEKELKGIPSNNLIECFEYLYGRIRLNQYNTIHLYDEKLSVFDYEKLSRIICLAKILIIHTMELDRAKALAEEMFYEYGVWIEIRDGFFECRNGQMVIDADNGKVRIGDVTVDGVEYDIDCGKYNLDFRSLADNRDMLSHLKVKNLKAGKNLIKLVDN